MKRLPLPDLLKGFAVFLIIPVHILETFIDFPGRESVFGKILYFLGGPVAVPVFMMVMGYFIAQSTKNSNQLVARGIKILFLGFLLNIGLNFHLLLNILFKAWRINPWEYTFGVDIFYFSGLAIIFLAFVKQIKSRHEWILLPLVLLIALSTSPMNRFMMSTERNYLFPFIAGTYYWSYFPLFPWMVYPLLGFLIQKKEAFISKLITERRSEIKIACAMVLIVLIVFREFGFTTTINLNKSYHHAFPYFLWALGVIFLWTAFLRQVVIWFNDFPVVVFLRWLGKNITVFYIIQWLIIGNIATSVYQTKTLSEYPFWFAGIFLVTTGLTFLVEKYFTIHKAGIKDKK